MNLNQEWTNRDGRKVMLLGTVSDQRVREEIERVAPGWWEARTAESSMVVALPGRVLDDFRAIFSLRPEDLEAERLLARGCGKDVGMSSAGEVVRSDCLFDPPRLDESLLLSSPWFAERLDSIRQCESALNDIRSRRRAAVGWMIFQSRFRQERDCLRQQWLQLSEEERPQLPLKRRALQVSSDAIRQLSENDQIERGWPAPADFYQAFHEFCKRWYLTGMLTWQIPQVEPPLWPDVLHGLADADVFRTPPHFPLLERDGLGSRILDRHRQRAEEYGFVDQTKWQIWARLLELSFWEQVIDDRYADRQRPRRYVGLKEGILANLLSVEMATVKNLRFLASQLNRGQRTDLCDWR